MDELPHTTLTQPQGTTRRKGGGIGGILAGLGLAALKFGKVALPLLKTGGSMLLMIWIYSLNWGWPFAVGFVILILVHECGHVIMAKVFGLPVSAPLFIPFMGAFIALKNAPRDAWMEACVGIGGPALGTLGAFGAIALAYFTGNPLYLAIAYSACFLNLFNLIPISPLDGGRIAAAISPWLWAVGVVVLGAALWLGWLHFNFIILAILILGALRMFRLFQGRGSQDAAYYSVSIPRRCLMAVLYIGLAGVLVYGMTISRVQPPHMPAQYSLASLR